MHTGGETKCKECRRRGRLTAAMTATGGATGTSRPLASSLAHPPARLSWIGNHTRAAGTKEQQRR